MDVANRDTTMPRIVLKSEYGLTVAKESAAVQRTRQRSSKELLGNDSRSIGYHQQDQQLKQQ